LSERKYNLFNERELSEYRIAPAIDFQYSLGSDYDFDKNFPQLIESLMKEKFLIEKDGYYEITEKGLHKIKDSIYKKIST
jgi:hypothetical protein